MECRQLFCSKWMDLLFFMSCLSRIGSTYFADTDFPSWTQAGVCFSIYTLQDILRVNGKWQIFGEFGFVVEKELLDPDFFLEYFRLLAGKKSALKEKEWQEILAWNRMPGEHYMTWEIWERIIALLKERKQNSEDDRLKPQPLSNFCNIVVYLSSQNPKNPFLRENIINFGRFLVEHQMTLVFGGSNCGMMKLLADTVLENGGKVIGIFSRCLPAKLIRDDLTEKIMTDSLAERKAEMLKRADAIVALPGSFGTWDELFDALEQKKLGNIHCPIGVLDFRGFYRSLFQMIQESVGYGLTLRRHQSLLKSAEDPEKLFLEFAEELNAR